MATTHARLPGNRWFDPSARSRVKWPTNRSRDRNRPRMSQKPRLLNTTQNRSLRTQKRQNARMSGYFYPDASVTELKKWTPCYLIEPEPHWKPVSNGRKKKCVMYFVYIYVCIYICVCVYIYIYIYNHYYTIKRMFTQFRTLRVKMHVTDFGPPPAPLWRDVITLRLCRLFTVESKHVFPQSPNQFCSTVVMFVMDIFLRGMTNEWKGQLSGNCFNSAMGVLRD